MDEDLSSIDRSRTPWVIFIGWVNYLNFPLPIARLKIDQAGKPGCSIILAFVFLGLLCILESVLCLWDTINNIWHFTRHCRHRPMYSSHGGILPNVDSNFVASVEPLLLNYQVKNHAESSEYIAPHYSWNNSCLITMCYLWWHVLVMWGVGGFGFLRTCTQLWEDLCSILGNCTGMPT